jgi:hypothetical protein
LAASFLVDADSRDRAKDFVNSVNALRAEWADRI